MPDAWQPAPDAHWHRWQDSKLTTKLWASFDDDSLPKLGLLTRWFTGVICAAIIAVCFSIPLAICAFPPAGYKGSTLLQNVMCAVMWAVGAFPQAEVFSFFDPQLSTANFWGLWVVAQIIISIGVRTIVEQATGAREDLILVYLILLLTAYPTLVPLPNVAARIGGVPKWWVTTKDTFRCFLSPLMQKEINASNGLVVVGCLYLGYLIADPFIKREIPKSTVTVLRPMLGMFVKRITVHVCYRCLKQTKSPSSKVVGLLAVYSLLAGVTARVATGSADWHQLRVNLIVDWVFFFHRSFVFWNATAPPPRAPIDPMKEAASTQGSAAAVQQQPQAPKDEKPQLFSQPPGDTESAKESSTDGAAKDASADNLGDRPMRARTLSETYDRPQMRARTLSETFDLEAIFANVQKAPVPVAESPSKPKPPPRGKPTWFVVYLKIWTFDKLPQLPGMARSDFRTYEYQIEGFTVTTMLMVNFCIYAMLKLFGFGVGYPAFDFWFPRGENSLYFTLVAFGLELVQDLVAHIIAEKAARRHPGKCKFTRMYPGWLLKPSTGLVPVAKACCSVSNAAVFMTQLSFAMRQLYDI